jgi:hypothetical protein
MIVVAIQMIIRQADLPQQTSLSPPSTLAAPMPKPTPAAPPQQISDNETLLKQEVIKAINKASRREKLRVNNVETINISGLINVDIFITLKSMWSEETFFLEMDSALVKSCQLLAQKWPNQVRRVIFFLHGPVVDKYGKEDTALAMKLYFNMSDLKKANWEHMQVYQDLLNLVDDAELKPFGRQIAAAYCGKKNNAELSNLFCGRFLRPR